MPKSKSTGVTEPSQRQLRVGEELRHALVQSLERGHIHDPDIVGQPITVTEVRPSPDLKNATAYVMPLGGVNQDKTVAALNRASGFLRREVAQQVHLKYVPKILFKADRSFDEGDQIDDLLRSPEVARDLSHTPADHADDTDPNGDDRDGD